jgi:hypothetical protein
MKSDTSLQEVHEKYKDQDGAVYITYIEMNTFG